MKVNKGPSLNRDDDLPTVTGFGQHPARITFDIHLVVKAPSICHHSKSCEETLRKAMEGMEYS